MPPLARYVSLLFQAKIYEKTLSPIRERYGYSAALWCSFYSVMMTGKYSKFKVGDTQPNNPNFKDWYASLLCPWEVEKCGKEPLGMHGDEWKGMPVEGATNQNKQYITTPTDPYVQNEPDRRTMSCGLCGHLKRVLGDPPYMLEPTINDPGNEHLYKENWDFHPFGAWLANDAKINNRLSSDIVRPPTAACQLVHR